MAKIYDTEGKILTGENFPQLKIGQELFIIDNRKSTYDKIQKLMSEAQTNPKADVNYDMEMIKFAMGGNKAQIKKIEDMDLSVKSFQELTFYIMAAIQEEEYEKIKEAALKNQ
ncbi:MAG: hypothetical protein J6J11_01655 [Treponema sp.]|nr:hypothetical protein [Clostridia bacterium]MBP3607009.1 hypothetical protein [Treponema sp.]